PTQWFVETGNHVPTEQRPFRPRIRRRARRPARPVPAGRLPPDLRYVPPHGHVQGVGARRVRADRRGHCTAGIRLLPAFPPVARVAAGAGSGTGCTEPVGVTVYGWWWDDYGETVDGDIMTCPDGSRVDLFRRPTGWMISPVDFTPDRWTRWSGCRVERRPYPPRQAPPICPVYSAYLLLPHRGWW